jgi:hypothetical protein
MSEEHGLTLLESEIDEIIRLAKQEGNVSEPLTPALSPQPVKGQTPRTDALEDRQCACDASAVDDLVESYGLARQLERELGLSHEETAEVIKFSRQVELELRDWLRRRQCGASAKRAAAGWLH